MSALIFVAAKFQYLTFSTHILSVLSSTSVLHNSSVKIRWLLVPRRPRCTVPRKRSRGHSLPLPVSHSWNSRTQQCGSQATWVFGENCWLASHHSRFIIVLPMQSPSKKKKNAATYTPTTWNEEVTLFLSCDFCVSAFVWKRVYW